MNHADYIFTIFFHTVFAIFFFIAIRNYLLYTKTFRMILITLFFIFLFISDGMFLI